MADALNQERAAVLTEPVDGDIALRTVTGGHFHFYQFVVCERAFKFTYQPASS